MRGFLRDLRFGFRMSKKNPGFTAVVLLSLSLGVAATTTIFSVIYEVIAGIALFLSSIGIYGVMSHSVAQRTSEIGLRMAIGADTSDVLRLVFSQGAKLIFAGLGIGLALALILDRFLASYLFGIPANDPTTMFACSVLLVATAVGAIWIPAQRASRVDPIVALRVD